MDDGHRRVLMPFREGDRRDSRETMKGMRRAYDADHTTHEQESGTRPTAGLDRAVAHPAGVTLTPLGPTDVLALQRTIGNRSFVRATGPRLTIQRTLWVADDRLVWQPQETGSPPRPSVDATHAGQMYDDRTKTLYPDQAAYLANTSKSDQMEIDSVPEVDDDSEDEYLLNLEEHQDDSEEEGSDDDGEMDASQLPDSDSTMTLDERRQVDTEALLMPVRTSSTKTSEGRKDRALRKKSTDIKYAKSGRQASQRQKKFGPVNITLETVALYVNDKREERERPVLVEGLVEPTTTTGRQGAPDPHAAFQIYYGKKGQLGHSLPAERNFGRTDAERGHVMALELGGPDISENIVPQWAKFQGSGAWRAMEQAVLKKALAVVGEGNFLRYKVVVSYKDTGDVTPSLNTFAFPSHFRATTQVVGESGDLLEDEVVVFDKAQSQDVTDKMLAERVLGKTDPVAWDKDLDVTKKRKQTSPPRTKKRKQTSQPGAKKRKRTSEPGAKKRPKR